MQNILKHKFFRILSLLFIVLQFFQPLSEVGATTIEKAKDKISITNVKQTDQNTMSLDLQLNNTTQEAIIEEIDFSDGIKATPTQGFLVAESSKDEVGTYQIEENKMTLQVKPGTIDTKAAAINIQLSSFDTDQKNYLTLNGEKVFVEALSSSVKETEPTSNSDQAILDAAPLIKNTLDSKIKVADVVDPNGGNDITQFLPDRSNGTIIDQVVLTAKDSDGNLIDLDQINQNTDLNFDYSYSVPTDLKDDYDIKPGDYFEFQLPENITYRPVPNPTPIDDYITYTITSDGKVRLTFTDAVNDGNEVSGDFIYNVSIAKNGDVGKNSIPIDTTSGLVEIPYVVKPTGGKDIDKSGVIVDANSSGNNPSKITWTVNVNTNGNHLINASVSDPAIKDTTDKVLTSYSSITVYPQTVNLDGTVTSTGDPLVEGKDYTQGPDGTITFIGDYADTYQSFKIVYQSDIDTSQVPDDGGNVTFTNTATLNNDGQPSKSNPATVVAKYGVLLNKTFDGEDPNGGQKYNWHVDYNFGQKNLPAGTTLIDTLTAGQIFPGDPTLTYEDGTPITDDYSVTYNADKTEMTIEFTNGLSKGVKVSYQSQVTNPIGDEGTTIGNTVASNGKTITVDGKGVGSQGISKSLGAVDYDKKTVAWTININKAQMDMKNWSMIDVIPNGLTLDLTTVKITDTTTKKKLVLDKDYTVSLDNNNLTVKFIGDLQNSAKDWYVLEYTTAFETKDIPKGGTWSNNVTANWEEQNGTPHTNKGSTSFTPKPEYVSDATKSGAYNAKTKQFTWTIVGNYNQRELTGASITDPIIGDQDYVDGSAKLYEATINKDGSYTLGKEVTDNVPTYDKTSKTVSVDLPEGSTQTYVLIFNTSLEDKVISSDPYENDATYVNNGDSTSLETSVKVPNGGSLIEKNGQQDPNDATKVIWNIWVNKTQSTVSDAKIVDNPSDNQVIDASSIKVYPTTVDSNGNFTEDNANPLEEDKDYTVNIDTDNSNGQQVLTIKFLKEITSAYSIYYSALINSSLDKDTITNTAQLTGTGNGKVDSGEQSGSTQVVNIGGSSNGKNTTLVLTKTDQTTQKVIEGVQFEIWSSVSGKKGQLLRTGTTDQNGQISWANLKSGKYILVETSAPDGYVISDELKNGKAITLDYANANQNNQVQVPVTNLTGKITVQKTDSDTGKFLPGASFDLYLKGDGTNKDQLISSGKTDSQGKLSFDNLDAGSYYLIETATPDGYILDATPRPVTVDGSHIQPTITIGNAEKTGSITLTKTDSDTGKILPGATFSLYKENGALVKGGLVSDQNGEVTVNDLKPGGYYFQETQAPAGYILDSSKIVAVVGLQTSGVKPVQVTAGNAEKTGSVTLTKTDSDTGKVLSDAIFSIYKANGDLVKSGLISDDSGKITIDDLKPGGYYFQETQAPAGYVLDDSMLPFTIDLQTVAKVATVSAENEQRPGSVVLTKIDGDTKAPLAGAEFSIFSKDGVELRKGLYSDENGEIKVDDLKPGVYYFQETKAPAGYDLNISKVYFTINLQTNVEVSQVSVENSETVGSVVLTKFDKDTGQVLPGATFNLYNANGNKIQENLSSNSQGQIKVDNLKPGNYYFQETQAPAGYDLDDRKLPFAIELQTETKIASVKAENAESVGSVVLTKVDSDTRALLAGAIFSLFDSSDKEIKSNLVTDENGEIKVNGLKPGDYYFQETQAPAGYVLNHSHLPFTIELQTEVKAAQVSAANRIKTGSVILTKTDSDTGGKVKNATFSLFNRSGELLKSKLTTNQNGEIKVDDLKPGDYYFQETQAPAGYVLNDKKIYFTIKFQVTTEVAHASAENAEVTGSVILTKKDNLTGKVLPGAKFSLFDSNGKLVKFDLLTDMNGQIKVSDLKPGNYYFVETAAPIGYKLNSSTKYSFTVEFQDAEKIARIDVDNTKIAVNYEGLPKTGDDQNIPFMLSGVLLSVIAILIYLKKKFLIKRSDID